MPESSRDDQSPRRQHALKTSGQAEAPIDTLAAAETSDAEPAAAISQVMASSQEPALAGWSRVDGDNVLRGWATDRHDRTFRAVVDIFIDDEPVASLKADLFDPKLVELGEGDGHNAFAMVIPEAFRDGQEHRFDARVREPRFVVRSKQPTFVISPDQALPTVEIDGLTPGGIRGVVIGGQYSKSAALYFWQDGERLDIRVDAEWAGGHDVREFFIPLTAEIMAVLSEGDVSLAASGMQEAGLTGAPLERIEILLSAECDERGVLTISMASPLISESETIQVDLRGSLAQDVILSNVVALTDGRCEIELPLTVLDDSLTVSVSFPDLPLPALSAQVRKHVGRLTSNGSFQFWSGEGLSDWETPAGNDRLVRGFYAFPERIAAEHGVSGDYAHFDCEGPASEIVLLRQALGRSLPIGQPVEASILFRAAEPLRIWLRVVDGDGVELGSVQAASRRAWAWDLVTEQIEFDRRIEGSVFLELVAESGATPIDVAGLLLGGDGFAERFDAADPEIPGDNLVENANLEIWPKGVVVDLVGRGEIAGGWFGFNRRTASPVRARAIFVDAASDQIGLALAADKVPEYCRLEVRLNTSLMSEMQDGVLRFEAGTPTVARRLFSASTVPLPEFLLIERIMVLKRAEVPTATGFSLVDETLAVVGRKLVVSRRYQTFELPFTLAQSTTAPEFEWEAEDTSAEDCEYFMVFEFRQPFAVAFRGVSVSFDRGQSREETAPYLALEDRNIIAQAEYIRGLASWVGSTIVTPGQRQQLATEDHADPLRWRWTAAAAGSVEVVVCVYNAIEETLACLESLIGSTEVPHTVRIIDDGSEPTVNRRLAAFVRDKPWMTLSVNAENRGYTFSADRGLRDSDADWVVLLNSDTIVTPGWLEGLIECAVSDPTIGFVGPLSNAATFQSVPELYDSRNQWKTNDLPQGWTPARMAALIRESSTKIFPDAPLLNGFCTLMRRAVFLEVGGLNHSAFPTGYGEENDLCLRVSKAGYRLALADHVYVYHSKSASFGSARRTELAKAGGKALRELHPDVDLGALTAGFRDIPALVSLRATVRSAYENQA